uniref:Uncharacterized protein n=1 Tax=Ignisphaera aggregans TaxID=334771 RepID=A0A7C5Z0X4_9CREN
MVEIGPKMNALLWLPIAVIIIIIAFNFLPYLVSSFGEYSYFAYIAVALTIFFSIYLFYKKWRGEA